MTLQEKLEEKIADYNKTVEALATMNERRLSLMGQLELLSEQIEEAKEGPTKKEKPAA